jgi:hypothetical protein
MSGRFLSSSYGDDMVPTIEHVERWADAFIDGLLDEEPAGEGGRSELRFYRFGEWGPLVGRDVDELEVDGGASHSGRLDRPRTTTTSTGRPARCVACRAWCAPATETSTPCSSQERDRGGLVAPPRRHARRSDWYTMVPEWFFVEGDNRIELYSATGSPTTPCSPHQPEPDRRPVRRHRSGRVRRHGRACPSERRRPHAFTRGTS